MFSIGLDHTAGIYSTDLGEKKKMGGGNQINDSVNIGQTWQ